jgi:hypothetical protein
VEINKELTKQQQLNQKPKQQPSFFNRFAVLFASKA